MAGPLRVLERTGRAEPMAGSQPTFTLEDMSATPGVIPSRPTQSEAPSTFFPTLHWSPVAEATRYVVYVRRQGAQVWTSLGVNFSYPAGEDTKETWLSADTYQWKVEAWNGATFLSESSAPGTFVIDAPEEVTGQRVALSGTASSDVATSCVHGPLTRTSRWPSQQCTGLGATPVLRWDAQAGVGRYEVWLSRDQNLTNVIAKYSTEQTAFTPTTALFDSQAGSAYFWHVQPCKLPGTCRAPAPRGTRSTSCPRRCSSSLPRSGRRGPERRDVHVARLRGDEPGPDHSGARTRACTRSSPMSRPRPTGSRSTTTPTSSRPWKPSRSTRRRTRRTGPPIRRVRCTGGCRRSTAATTP